MWSIFKRYFYHKVIIKIHIKSAFTCNRDEISSRVKKCLFTREFHPGMKRVEFHPGMKFNLKENLPLSMMKTYNKISHFSQLLKSEA